MRRAFAFALSAGLLFACDSGLNARTSPDAPLAADAEFVTDSTGTLAASYAFNGSYRDGSGHGLDCTSQGVRFGAGRDRRLNTAAVFDGSAYLDCGDVLNDLQMPFSVTAWVWADAFHDGSTLLLATEHSPDINAGVALGLQSGNVGIQIGNGGGAGPNTRRTRGMAGPYTGSDYLPGVYLPLVPQGRWVMVTGVAASLGDFRLYLNGLNVGGADTGGASSLKPAALHMKIGAGFMGRMDDLKIYRRALSENEIARLAGEVPSLRSMPR